MVLVRGWSSGFSEYFLQIGWLTVADLKMRVSVYIFCLIMSFKKLEEVRYGFGDVGIVGVVS